MMQIALIRIFVMGLGAGAVSALLFASGVSGAAAAMLLLLLAPLPILIVALGWSHWAGLIAAATAAACLMVLGADVVAVYLIAIGMPAWWLGYLTLLARPAATPNSQEWYPVGRLVLWAAGINALIVGAALLSFGSDLASLQSGLHAMLDTRLDQVVGEELDNPDDIARLVDLMVMFVPAAAAVSFTLSTIVNLWLAGRIVKISGRLPRPWPRLADMRFPSLAPALLGAAVAGSFLPDLLGISLSALAASLMIAHVLLGLAVIHAVTVGLSGRAFVLGTVYAGMVVFTWPVRWPLLFIGLLGMTDALFDLRGLIARRRGPPAAPT
ncbi:MAG TPA: DUF2232 domain-containing protein [Xanthobacteraceae bacterium]|nr:DUF2232 domain-containing protein [Xanthobacteraceae bacterium]